MKSVAWRRALIFDQCGGGTMAAQSSLRGSRPDCERATGSLCAAIAADGHGYKHCLRGTHRLLKVEQTVERLTALMPSCGMTRLADITGLDRIGVPVAMVARPNAQSVSVSQGK